MWEEAVKRANTVYLPDYTIHMLPPVLAETVCSLVPNEDRLAHTVEMEIDDETLSFEDIDIYKSVINSDERLTYKECEERLEDPLCPSARRTSRLRAGRSDARTAQGGRLARVEPQSRPRTPSSRSRC